eukprot:174309-Amphidinium_carterae.3
MILLHKKLNSVYNSWCRTGLHYCFRQETISCTADMTTTPPLRLTIVLVPIDTPIWGDGGDIEDAHWQRWLTSSTGYSCSSCTPRGGEAADGFHNDDQPTISDARFLNDSGTDDLA